MMRLRFMCFVTASMLPRNWIFNNINKLGIGANISSCKTTFMTTCWFLWKWRNKSIFEDDFQQPNNPILAIHNFTTGMDLCLTQLPHGSIQRKEMIYIGWEKTPGGWIKLNSDGACKRGEESSGCGGIFRNPDGRWVKGYIKKIDNYKFRGVVPTLVQRIRNLLDLDWRVQFCHTWREGNRCADWLANFSLSLNFVVCARTETPPTSTPSLKVIDHLWLHIDVVVLQWIYSIIYDDLPNTIIERYSSVELVWNKLFDILYEIKILRLSTYNKSSRE
ncbi:hypothetical protein TSUD_243050 [Trifolium subterraneum]|uniref:RNase H type-1 domain-containing protein n=1 Tax=Trifolium subterraneum TaxID=3900 RepID=A0A2Z6PQJ0_TRISU|nr:hypothetical protein TSUD_243050 [Trifolium subterraneum]